MKKIGHGSITLAASRGKFYTVYGGPYRQRPAGTFGVRLAKEIQAEADVVVPIRDFSVPTERDLFEGLDRVLSAMIRRKPVYAGCMGGMGRTGLFLAALAKLWAPEVDSVEYVREVYYGRAVETEEQEEFITNLTFPRWLQKKARIAKLAGWIPSGKSITREVA